MFGECQTYFYLWHSEITNFISHAHFLTKTC